MPLNIEPVSLALDTQVTVQTWIHHTRDYHLVGIIAFSAPASQRQATWEDLEFMRRRVDEFAIVGFPDPLAAMVLDLRRLPMTFDGDAPILPWRLLEEGCPVRLLIDRCQHAHYSSVIEPAWLEYDLEHTLEDIRAVLDNPLQ